MTDERLRELERRWKETGSAEDEAAFLLEQVRAGGRERVVSRILISNNAIAFEALPRLLDGTPPRVVFDERHECCWRFRFLAPDGECELTGPFLTQAVGEIDGTEFYFRASGQEWEFETEIGGGPFPTGDPREFRLRQASDQAAEMDLELALGVLVTCVTRFLSHQRSDPEPGERVSG